MGSARSGSLLALMVALYGLALANIFLRSSMGVLAPELAAELELSPKMLGLTASAFFVGYALFQIPTGLMLDRFGPRITITGLFALTAAGTFLFALAPSGPAMVLSRVLMGVGCAGIFSGGFMIIARFYAIDRFTTVGGTWNAFAMVGTFLATAPLAALVAFAGWRAGFIGIAVAATALTVLTGLVLRDRPAEAVNEQAPPSREGLREILTGLREVIRTPGVLGIASCGLALSAGNTILGIWGGPYLNDVHGLAPVERGEVLLFMAIAGVIGHYLYGQAARLFNTLKGTILSGAAAISAIMATLALLDDPGIVTVTVLLALLGLCAGFPTIVLAHARALVPDRLAGRGLTTVNTGVMMAAALMQIAVGAVIGAVAPSETGQGTQEGYRAAFGFMACMAAIAFLIYLRVADRKPRS